MVVGIRWQWLVKPTKVGARENQVDLRVQHSAKGIRCLAQLATVPSDLPTTTIHPIDILVKPLPGATRGMGAHRTTPTS